jgi:hypothetical protein
MSGGWPSMRSYQIRPETNKALVTSRAVHGKYASASMYSVDEKWVRRQREKGRRSKRWLRKTRTLFA